MTTNYKPFDDALKTAVYKDKSLDFNWIEKDPQISVESIYKPTPSSAENKLTSKDILSILGESYEKVLIAKDQEEVSSEDYNLIVSLTKGFLSQNLFSRTTKYSKEDIYSFLESYVLEQNNTDIIELATSLIYHKRLSSETPSSGIKLIRRNNQVAPWKQSKIEIALHKAFLRMQVDPEPVETIATAVTQRVQSLNQAYIYIEEVQDFVQEALADHFSKTHDSNIMKVLEHYISYRTSRTASRALDEISPEIPEDAKNFESLKEKFDLDKNPLTYINKDGSKGILTNTDIESRIKFACTGEQFNLSITELKIELLRSTFPEMKVEDLQKTITLNAKSLIDRDVNMHKFAGRILLSYIYEEVMPDWSMENNGVKELKEAHKRNFLINLKRAEDIGIIDPAIAKRYKLEKIAKQLDPSADLELDYLGISSLYERYFIVDKKSPTSRRLETPQMFFMRVSLGLFLKDTGNVEKRATELYRMYSAKRVGSSSPTLFNSGTTHSQLSSCYISTVEDSIESIMQMGVANQAYLSKWAGGLGIDWTDVRGTGSRINGTNGESQGVIPFLKIFNDLLVSVNQCFSPDTMIFTDEGIKPISQIVAGQSILGENGCYNTVKEVLEHKQQDKPMVELVLEHSSSPTRVTASHPFFGFKALPGDSVDDIELKLKDAIYSPNWNDITKYSTDDYIGLRIPSEFVDAPISESQAYLYGAMLGTGTLTKNSDQADIHLLLNSTITRGAKNKITSILDEIGCFYSTRDQHSGDEIISWNYDAEDMEFLKSDLYNYFKKKEISPRFMHLPLPKAKALLTGFLESSAIEMEEELTYESRDYYLVETLRYQFLRFGIPCSITSTPEDVIKTLHIPSIGFINEIFTHINSKKNWVVFNDTVYSKVISLKATKALKTVYDLKIDSTGPASYCTTNALVHNGGKRRGSGCSYLEVWHNDFEDFLELRKNTGDDRRRCHDMNTAAWVPDLFMQRVEDRADWSLFRSSEVPGLHDAYGSKFKELYEKYEQDAKEGKIWSKVVPSLDIWKVMLKMYFETGHPWIQYKDAFNVRNTQDHEGVIHSSNLCTEIGLITDSQRTAVCNLASVNLEKHIENGKLDLPKLKETIRVIMRALDNVIDVNFYPTKEAKHSNSLDRPIGLGIMGLQNALYKLGYNFDSEEAVEFNDEFMEAISYYAIESSSDIAKEKGSYKTYKGSRWDRGILPIDSFFELEKERGDALITASSYGTDNPIKVPSSSNAGLDWTALREKVKTQGMRNSNTMAIAPTATLSNIMGTSPCIEPMFRNLYVKSNLGGDFLILNNYLVADLKKLNLWTKEIRDELKYYDGELQDIKQIPQELKEKYKTAFDIDPKWIIDAAARRQKWIDQAQSLNFWLKEPSLKVMSHMYKALWKSGCKGAYYLRSNAASKIEKATVSVKKDLRSRVGSTVEPATATDHEICESCQ